MPAAAALSAHRFFAHLSLAWWNRAASRRPPGAVSCQEELAADVGDRTYVSHCGRSFSIQCISRWASATIRCDLLGRQPDASMAALSTRGGQPTPSIPSAQQRMRGPPLPFSGRGAGGTPAEPSAEPGVQMAKVAGMARGDREGRARRQRFAPKRAAPRISQWMRCSHRQCNGEIRRCGKTLKGVGCRALAEALLNQ